MNFDDLSPRRRYASERRASLITKLIKEKKDISWVYSIEADLESLIKRTVGYANSDKLYDAGLYWNNKDIYVLFCRKKKNDDQFDILERVKYTDDLRIGTWLKDSIRKHII